MKAILLAGGFGTRLRPLTLKTPKPIVPIFDRPFLYYQIDLLKRLPEIDEVILSLNYQPDAIEQVVGDGSDAGLPVRYVVEPEPLGTGGAVKYAAQGIDDTIVVFNGDVLTGINLTEVVDLHRAKCAQATIVLTPVENPSAYGLVETDADGNVCRFLEKPDPQEITCDTINAGIYVLEPNTFDRIPPETKYSIERRYFPSLVERRETFAAYVDRGYWIDIGTSEKYIKAHRDIMNGRCIAFPFAGQPEGTTVVDATARVDSSARISGPCFVGAGATIGPGATVAAESVVGKNVVVGDQAVIEGAVVWGDSTIGEHAVVGEAIVGRGVQIGAHATITAGTVLGDGSVVTAYSRA